LHILLAPRLLNGRENVAADSGELLDLFRRGNLVLGNPGGVYQWVVIASSL
jgi:hypothetical protein